MIEITKAKRGNLAIKAPLLQDGNFEKLANIPGYKKWDNRLLLFRPVSTALDYVYETWPDANWIGEAKDILIAHRKDVEMALETKANKQRLLEDDGSYQYKTEPYSQQRQAFLLSRDMNWFALLMEMGTGKTKILIDNAAYLYEKEKIDCLLVIAPNGVHRNWVDIEIPIHFPDRINYKKDFYSSKHGKKRLAEIDKILTDKTSFAIIAINIEAFASRRAKEFLEDVIERRNCFTVLDESTTIKSPSAKRTQFLTFACKRAPYKRIANGAPITKGIEDLYAQFGFLSHNIIGYDNYVSFKAQYCVEKMQKVNDFDPDSKEYPKIVDYRNVDELVEKIDSYSFRVRKKDCLDLPEKIYKLWPVELTNQQKKAYVELKKEFETEIDGTVIAEEFAMVRLMRLQQITCGWYPDEAGNLQPIPGSNPRLTALEEICREVIENGEKAIIWARFKQDIKAIEDIIGQWSVSYHGDVSENERIENIDRFKNDDSVRFMIAMLSSNSGAVRGHTWTAASVSIYYSNIFDLDPRQQSEDRIHRIGMGDKALYIDLMAIGTIDRKIINALKSKKRIADLITRDGPSGFLEFIND